MTRKSTSEELTQVIEKHKKWLNNEIGGERAKLFKADLSDADLSGSNLYKADLSEADLSGAKLSGANLSGAKLFGADLSGADLYKADLSGADLYKADLSGAKLSGANLYKADLSEADLYKADLSEADLSGAKLSGAKLSGANLSNVKNAAIAFARTEIVPREGSFIGWKKCNGGVIVKLNILESAKRSNATGRKCRADKVRVLDVFGGKRGITDTYGPKTFYEKGKIVSCHEWDDNRWNECSGGIHFYITREEAEAQ